MTNGFIAITNKVAAKKTSRKSKPEDFAQAPINAFLTAEDKIALYRDMERVRIFEQQALQAYQKGKMGGFLHLYIGQESTAIGTVSLMGEHDHVITAYRDHGHALGVGMTMNECMAELYGKYTGCSKGKGGSMHFFAPDKNYWGGHGIVGGQAPLGIGLAYGVKYKKQKGCCMTYLGDGAINQGPFHESLNLAALFDLPCIFIIENNGYSMGTSQVRSSSYPEAGLAARAEGYNMEWDIVDGSSLYEVRAKTQKAIERAHNESKPTLLEIQTYRYYGHSIADANHQKYRSKEEIEAYKKNHDPISLFQSVLIEEGVLTEESVKEIKKAAKEEAKASVDFAEASPFPPAEEIYSDVYWEVDNGTEAGKTGTHFFNSLED